MGLGDCGVIPTKVDVKKLEKASDSPDVFKNESSLFRLINNRTLTFRWLTAAMLSIILVSRSTASVERGKRSKRSTEALITASFGKLGAKSFDVWIPL